MIRLHINNMGVKVALVEILETTVGHGCVGCGLGCSDGGSDVGE